MSACWALEGSFLMQKSSNATSKLCGGNPTNQDSELSQDSLRALFSIARAELHLQPLLILNRQHLPSTHLAASAA